MAREEESGAVWLGTEACGREGSTVWCGVVWLGAEAYGRLRCGRGSSRGRDDECLCKKAKQYSLIGFFSPCKREHKHLGRHKKTLYPLLNDALGPPCTAK